MAPARRRLRGFRWTPADPPAPAAWQQARRQVAKARRALAKGAADGAPAAVETGVHEARKALKRTRALLALVRPALDVAVAAALDQQVAEVGRRLSGARDAAILVTAARQACGGRAGLEPPFAPLLAALEAARDARGAAFSGGVEIDAVVAALRHVEGALAGHAAAVAADTRWDRGLRRLHRRGRASVAAALATPDDAHAHAVRRRWKQLGYVLRWLTPACPEVVGPYVRAVETALTALGDAQDQAVLRARLAAGVAGVDAAVVAEAIARSRAVGERRQATALAVLARLSAEPTTAFVARHRAHVAAARVAWSGASGDARDGRA